MKRNLFWLVVFSFVYCHSAVAQENKTSMSVGQWSAEVEEESRKRTMDVKEILSNNDGEFTINGEYGFEDAKKFPFTAKMKKSENGAMGFIFLTASKSKVDVIEKTPGTFEGRITNGPTYDRRITITKGLSSDKKPDANVPMSCAVFFGTWKGWWSQGGLPEMMLHVVEVKQDCKTKFFYYYNTKTSSNISGEVDVSNGNLTFLCNKETSGTCTFTVKGDELWGNYSNPGGGSNSGVFKKQ